MMFAPDLRSEMRWLSSGFLLMLYSGFGQTYFIALFAGQLKSDLAISDGEFGGLYTIGTLASAALLTWLGKLADTISIRWLGAGVIGGLAVTSLAMASVASPLMLAFVLFGLRFFGQGMLTHTSMTAMARWFNRKRGRAVSIAGLGLPASEGLMPPLAVAIAATVGWRETWLLSSAFLLLVVRISRGTRTGDTDSHVREQPVLADCGHDADRLRAWLCIVHERRAVGRALRDGAPRRNTVGHDRGRSPCHGRGTGTCRRSAGCRGSF